MSSMCAGKNLGWKYLLRTRFVSDSYYRIPLQKCTTNVVRSRYRKANSSLISTLSWKCLTAKSRNDPQEDCKGTSNQVFHFDTKTGHFEPKLV